MFGNKRVGSIFVPINDVALVVDHIHGPSIVNGVVEVLNMLRDASLILKKQLGVRLHYVTKPCDISHKTV